MSKKYLLIDTVSDKQSRLVWLGQEFKTRPRKIFLSLKKLFKSADLKKLEGLVIINGSGEFTSVRQGVTLANALAWALNLPIKPVRLGEKVDLKKAWSKKMVEPIYSRLPNITKPR